MASAPQNASPTQTFADGGILNQPVTGQPSPFNTQSAYNNFASPNQSFMDYPQQGAPNQSPMASPDMGGLAPNTNMGFDNSGSDTGVEGQPVNSMQSPMQNQNFGQPPMLSQYRPQQGLQVQGNPTSMPVQRPQQR
jgi:hypothetical protein